jgi:hypothetical protein
MLKTCSEVVYRADDGETVYVNQLNYFVAFGENPPFVEILLDNCEERPYFDKTGSFVAQRSIHIPIYELLAAIAEGMAKRTNETR